MISAKCFMCERKLGTTYGNLPFGKEKFCLRCCSRLRGLIDRAEEVLADLIREKQTAIGEEAERDIECGGMWNAYQDVLRLMGKPGSDT